MKRLILILTASLLALAGRAQGVEMFTLERNFEASGTTKEVLRERAWNWFRTMEMFPGHEFDFKKSLHEIGWREDWIRRRCNLNIKGKDYLTEYSFSLSITSEEDGRFSVRLYRPLVSAYRGNTTILSVDDLPVFYGAYREGMFGTSRNKEARIAVCDAVKRLLTEEFEELLPSIRESMDKESIRLDLVQE